MLKELIALYKQPSYDQSDIPKIRQIILDALTPLGYIDTVDSKGNLFMYHPESTCNTLLCAHMDMVKTGEPICNVMQFNGILMGLDKDNNLTSLGADDKNGVWLCMQAAKHSGVRPSLLFVAHEEGHPHTVDDFIVEYGDALQDYDCCLVLDRANANEIIYKGSYNDYSALLACQFKKCNPDWKFAKGIMCDADRLIKYMPCINLSIGYHNGHSVEEFTIIDELLGAKKALFNFLKQTEQEKNTIDWNVIQEFNETEKKGL